jgi:hypothetical protein
MPIDIRVSASRRCPALGSLILLAGLVGGCGDTMDDFREIAEVQRAIMAEFRTPVEIGLEGRSALTIRFVNASQSALASSEREAFARTVAAVGLAHYPRRDSLTSIAVTFRENRDYGPVHIEKELSTYRWSPRDLGATGASPTVAPVFDRASTATSTVAGASPPASPSTVAIRVVDSTSTSPGWDPMSDEVTVYRVEVGTGERRDTIADVLAPLPIISGDSLIVGLRLRRHGTNDAYRVLFRRRATASTLETWALPPDVWYLAHDVVPSPDGRHLAYVGQDDRGTVAVVRELRTGLEVARGGEGGGCNCDVDTNHARWFAPDSFEIAVAHTATDRGWRIVAGRASTRRVHVTTLSKEPKWHP